MKKPMVHASTKKTLRSTDLAQVRGGDEPLGSKAGTLLGSGAPLGAQTGAVLASGSKMGTTVGSGIGSLLAGGTAQ